MITRNILLLPFTMILACAEDKAQTDSVTGDESSEDVGSNEQEQSEQNEEGNGSSEYPLGVSTLAGSGEFASEDGVGVLASFAEPKAVRIGNNGELIVADSATGAIRIVEMDGTVSTLALTGTTPVAPSGIAMTEDGTLYISDYQEHCIYKIEGSLSSVFAGSCGEAGYQNGSDARFEQPRSLVIDDDGNLLVADAANSTIRSITPSGEVSTVVGTGEKFVLSSEGPALEANLYLPFGLAIHPDGDLYISGFDHCIRRVRDGYLEDVAGLCMNYGNTGDTDGALEDARFDTPLDIAFLPDGTLAIADSFNDRLRFLSADITEVGTLTGSDAGFQDGALSEALFEVPRSLTVDQNGTIYVADSVNNRIRVIAR